MYVLSPFIHYGGLLHHKTNMLYVLYNEWPSACGRRYVWVRGLQNFNSFTRYHLDKDEKNSQYLCNYIDKIIDV